MKIKTLIFLVFLLSTIITPHLSVDAQAPPTAIKYQMVVRSPQGAVIQNQKINVKISLLKDSINGTIAYAETHLDSTTRFGIVNLEIGRGTPLNGTFAELKWNKHHYFIELAIDLDAGSSFVVFGTSELLSVPYAMYAQTADCFPPGVVFPFTGTIVPTGWLLCNGDEINRADYSDLFATIGTNWGKGNGSNTFNLPDFRGRFLRGVDAGTGNDPDAAQRNALYAGGLSGDTIATYQNDTLKTHAHIINTQESTSDANTNHAGNANSTNNQSTIKSQNYGGHETRPKNAAVYFIIKY